MITDIQDYLLRRKELYPGPAFGMESDYVELEGTFLYRAYIFNRFYGEWKYGIEDALDSLEQVLRDAGEIE